MYVTIFLWYQTQFINSGKQDNVLDAKIKHQVLFILLIFHQLRFHLAGKAKFVHPCMINFIYPSLVQKYEENNIVAEAADSV